MLSFFALFVITSNFLAFDVLANSVIKNANSTELEELEDVLVCIEYNNTDPNNDQDTNYTFFDFDIKEYTGKDIPLVAGGVLTLSDEFKFMTAIGSKQLDGSIDYHCGGALIAEKVVLTAAHCTANKQVAEFVRIGGAPLDSDEPEHQPIEVTKIHVHPLYKRKEFYNDIALLELKESPFHLPICMWKNHTVDVENVTAIGYGQEVFAGPNKNELLKTTLALVPNENCSSYYPPYAKLQDGVVDTQLCAGDFSGVRDTCQGDSGGPIVAHIGEWPYEYPYVIGVTSFGQGCASGAPSIYVRISKYLDWMKEVTNEEFSCDQYNDD